ncbi:RHS repeat-associated core domain-containing protein [Leucothrix arctica]|uniref:Type IV secretion protein Rhs n=1 Tax=Leucothrix arctica TaxID=1481894 RepID=A0A317CFF7_9GAMM|nr:RHS repeat-associated core domain-containing protein [Leucothrix arctica]PWQ95050.1 type IV secretion protein Rhs [Leucothrix arctica]
MGNRISQTENGITTSYTYNANDHLLESNDGIVITSYQYDANGNTTQQNQGLAVTAYEYSQDNRMIRATSSTDTLDYSYNASGIRQSKTQNGITTNYLVDQNRPYAQVITELDNTGTPETFYTYGDDLVSQIRGSQSHYYLYDGLGSTRGLSDQSGAVTDSYVYKAFGELVSQLGATENSYQFAGEQFDGELDQYYLRARYYDQGAGRFTQQDTWMGRSHDPITLNKYLYANSNSVLYLDPSGYSANLAGVSAASSIQGTIVSTAHRTVIKHVFKSAGCDLAIGLAEKSITYGIYVLFDAASGRYYVGQAGNINTRYKQHLKEAERKAISAWKANSKIVARFFVGGGKDALDKIEQLVINYFEDAGHNLHNDRRVIGDSKDREKLRKEFRLLKKTLCK